MKKLWAYIATVLLCFTFVVAFAACTGGENESQTEDNQDMEVTIMYITVNENKMTVNLANNRSARALTERLKQGDVTLTMNDYGNMEKVGDLGFSLPESNTPTNTRPGDVILYLGDSLVIYYDTNSWNFTPIGHIEGVTTREQMLSLLGGTGRITVTLSLD